MLGVVLGKLCFHLCVSILPFRDVGCTGTSAPIGCVEVFEVLRMLDAQVVVCLPVGLKCWKFYVCWMHRY